MKVSILTSNVDGSFIVIMDGGSSFFISRHGWIFERDRVTPVPHPLVDEIMRAVATFELGLKG